MIPGHKNEDGLDLFALACSYGNLEFAKLVFNTGKFNINTKTHADARLMKTCDFPPIIELIEVILFRVDGS